MIILKPERYVFCSYCDRIIDTDNEFRDELSMKEYRISGFCQFCQDIFFREDGTRDNKVSSTKDEKHG
jgi:hypothetical protein